MIKLDYLTIAIILSMMCFIISIILMILKIINKKEKGIELLALSSFINTFTFFAAIFDPLIGTYQIFLSNIGTLSSVFILFEGILQFKNYRKNTSRKKTFFFIFIIIIFISYINRNNPTNRFLIHDSIMAFMLIIIALFFIKGTKGNERKISRIFAYTFIFEALWFIYRWFLALNRRFENGNLYYPFMGIFLIATAAWLMVYILGILLIISYRAQLSITELASTDSLTGLKNRRSLNENLQYLIDNYDKNDADYILFLIDLNGFKQINDNYGHAFGDLVLKKMSEKLKQNIREGDLSGRLGGDEFILLIKTDKNMKDINNLMERIRKKIQNPINIENYTVKLKISIGYAPLTHKNTNIDELMSRADIMMYKEKTKDRKMSSVSKKNNFIFSQ